MEFTETEQGFKSIKSRNYRKIWKPFMQKYNCESVCELGVFEGDNFMEMIAHGPKLALAVDTWKNDSVHSSNETHYTKKELSAQYKYFKERTNRLPFVKIIHEDTTQAARHFDDESLDFVYIDADHSEKACYADIINWYPKVKPDKFLVGHDYSRRFGVVRAVDKFIEENRLQLIRFGHSNWAVVKK